MATSARSWCPCLSSPPPRRRPRLKSLRWLHLWPSGREPESLETEVRDVDSIDLVGVDAVIISQRCVLIPSASSIREQPAPPEPASAWRTLFRSVSGLPQTVRDASDGQSRCTTEHLAGPAHPGNGFQRGGGELVMQLNPHSVVEAIYRTRATNGSPVSVLTCASPSQAPRLPDR
jgi:hypothetical protein